MAISHRLARLGPASARQLARAGPAAVRRGAAAGAELYGLAKTAAAGAGGALAEAGSDTMTETWYRVHPAARRGILAATALLMAFGAGTYYGAKLAARTARTTPASLYPLLMRQQMFDRGTHLPPWILDVELPEDKIVYQRTCEVYYQLAVHGRFVPPKAECLIDGEEMRRVLEAYGWNHANRARFK